MVLLYTPVGYLCQGRLLQQNHPFFAMQSADAGEFVAALAGCRGIGGNLKEAEEEKEGTIHEWNPIVQSNKKISSQGRNQKTLVLNFYYFAIFLFFILHFIIFFWVHKYVKFIQDTIFFLI